MRRLALFLAPLVLAVGCHFPQGWHYARLVSNGSSTSQTLICFQNDLVGYQGPYMAYGARLLNAHPEIAVITRDTCPLFMNRMIFRTVDLPYPYVGLTTFGCCLAGNHSNWSDVRLDVDVGRVGTIAYSQSVIRHEALCHGMGGGFGTDAQHQLCNDWPHTSADIAHVSHDDLG